MLCSHLQPLAQTQYVSCRILSELILQEAKGMKMFMTYYCVKYLHVQSVYLWLAQSVRSPPSYPLLLYFLDIPFQLRNVAVCFNTQIS